MEPIATLAGALSTTLSMMASASVVLRFETVGAAEESHALSNGKLVVGNRRL